MDDQIDVEIVLAAFKTRIAELEYELVLTRSKLAQEIKKHQDTEEGNEEDNVRRES